MTLARAVEVGEVDALPATQHESPTANGHRLRGPDEGGLDMGRGVALGVLVVALPGHERFEGGEDVSKSVWVGVFIDKDARGRVRHVNLAEAGFHTAFADHPLHALRDV